MPTGSKLEYSGPRYSSMKVEGNAIRIRFTHVDGGLVAKDGPLKWFQIAGADQQFVDADATIEGNTVVVKSDKVPAPVAVRYAWANYPIRLQPVQCRRPARRAFPHRRVGRDDQDRQGVHGPVETIEDIGPRLRSMRPRASPVYTLFCLFWKGVLSMSSSAVDFARQNHPRFLDELKALLRIPSISTLPENKGDCRHAAEVLAAELKRIGMENVRLIETEGHPLVYADWLHAAGKPTVPGLRPL